MTTKILILLAVAVLAYLLIGFLKNHPRFRSSLHSRYLLQLVRLVVILLCIAEMFEALNPELDIKSILIGGSALVVAILGFAAQTAISDIICGLLISIHKPFEIGDRIIVEGQNPGIVEDITLRHTVIRIYDNQRIIVPNSDLNSKIVTNTSYRMKDRRGIHLSFSVSYDTDIQKAMDVIRDCVEESPYTLSVETDGIREDSGPVYFLKYADSALILETTIWVAWETSGYKATTDVNTRVLNAFRLHGIEIPYPYVNVVQFEGSKDEAAGEAAGKNAASVNRHRRSTTVHMAPGASGLEEAIQAAKNYAKRQNLGLREAMQLELLTEESIGFIQRVVDHTARDFWIEGTASLYRIHIRFAAKVGSEEYKKLIEVSTSGRNEAVNDFYGRIWEAVLVGLRRPQEKNRDMKESYEWNLNEAGMTEEEIGKSILGAVASNVRVNVTSERVELIVSKSNK